MGGPLTYEEAYAATDRWTTEHAWEFEGDVTDSVGGVTATLDDVYNKAPTFADGKITVNSSTVYNLGEDITLGANENFMISIKGSFAPNKMGTGIRRIFENRTTVNSIIGYVYMPGTYNLSWCFNPNAAFNKTSSLYEVRDESDLSGEHVTDLLHYNGMRYVFVDGVLIDSYEVENTADFIFNDMFGASRVNNAGSTSANVNGTIDYIRISTFN
jgi:hypothetical protein